MRDEETGELGLDGYSLDEILGRPGASARARARSKKPEARQSALEGLSLDAILNRGQSQDQPAPNAPGLVTSLKNQAGGMLESMGQYSINSDNEAGPVQRWMTEKGQEIQERNPTAINSLSDAAESPWLTVKESVGAVAPSIAQTALLAKTGAVLGGFTGPAAPIVSPALAIAFPLAAGYFQSTGGIQKTQKEAGIQNDGVAHGAGAAIGVMDRYLGIDGLVGKFAKKGAIDTLTRESGDILSKQTLKSVGKHTAIGIATEGPTEWAQTGIENWAGKSEDPFSGDAVRGVFSDESLAEMNIAGLKGAIGGGGVRGTLSLGSNLLGGSQQDANTIGDKTLGTTTDPNDPDSTGAAINGSFVGSIDPNSPAGNTGVTAPLTQEQIAQNNAAEAAKAAAQAQANQTGAVKQQQANQQAAANQQQANQVAGQQQAAQQSAVTVQKLASQYGITPQVGAAGQPTGKFTVGGKLFNNEAGAVEFTKEMDAAGKDLPPMQQTLIGKLLSVDKLHKVNVAADDSGKKVVTNTAKFLKSVGLDTVQSVEEAVAQIDALIEHGANKVDLKPGAGLTDSSGAKIYRDLDKLRKSLTGESSTRLQEMQDEQLSLQVKKEKEAAAKKTSTTSTKSKGATNGQQKQTTSGVGEVSVTSGTAGLPANGPGDVRTDGNESVGAGAQPTLQDGQQDDGGGSAGDGQRAADSTAAGGNDSANGQAPQEVTGSQERTTTSGKVIGKKYRAPRAGESNGNQTPDGQSAGVSDSGAASTEGGSTAGAGSQAAGASGANTTADGKRGASETTDSGVASTTGYGDEGVQQAQIEAEIAADSARSNSFLYKVLDAAFKIATPSETNLDKKARFFADYFGIAKADWGKTLQELADDYEISLSQAKRWSAQIPTFYTAYGTAFAQALKDTAQAQGMTVEQAQKQFADSRRMREWADDIEQMSERSEIETDIFDADQDRVMTVGGKQMTAKEAGIREAVGTEEEGGQLEILAGKTSKGMEERGAAGGKESNAYLKWTQKGEALQAELEKAQDEGDFEAEEAIQAKIEAHEEKLPKILEQVTKAAKKGAKQNLSGRVSIAEQLGADLAGAREDLEALRKAGTDEGAISEQAAEVERLEQEIEQARDSSDTDSTDKPADKPAAKKTRSRAPKKEATTTEKKAEPVLQTHENAGAAWDKAMAPLGDAGMPWSSLTEEQQDTFYEFRPENWSRDDVMGHAKKIEAAEPKTEVKAAEPTVEKITPAKTGQTFTGPARAAPIVMPSRMARADLARQFTKALRDGDIDAGLKFIVNNGSPMYRLLATKLRKLLSSDITMRVIAPGKKYEDGGIPRSLNTAYGVASLDRDKKKVTIFLRGDNGLTPSTFMHEVIHAVIMTRFDMLSYYLGNPDKVKSAADPALKTMLKMYNEFTALIKQKYPTMDELRKAPTFIKEPYQNPDEFLTYALTNAELQAWMQKTKYNGTAIWQQFRDFVAQALGFGTKGPTWLDAALQVSNDVIDSAALVAPDFASTDSLHKRGKTEDVSLKTDLQMFAGNKGMKGLGNSAIKHDFAAAKELVAAGMPMEDIRQATGWYKAKDGKWRFEIDDSTAEFTVPTRAGEYKLSEMLTHPTLFKAYPQLADMTVEYDPKESENLGWFDPVTFQLGINGSIEEDIADTILHEVQHAVQHIEGFAPGGGPGLVDFNKYAYGKNGTPRMATAEDIDNLLDVLGDPKFLPDDIPVKARPSLNAVLLQIRDVVAELAPLQRKYDRLSKSDRWEDNLRAENMAGPITELEAELASIDNDLSNKQLEYFGAARYLLLHGETEAVNTGARRSFSAAFRREVPIDVTAQVNSNNLLVSDDAAGAQAVAQKRKIERNVSRLPAKVRPVASMTAKAANRVLNYFSFTGDIVARAEKLLPSASKYLKAMREGVALRAAERNVVEKIGLKFEALPKAEQTAVNKLLKESTTSKKWAFKPSWVAGATVDPELAEKYDALSKEAATIVREVFAHGYNTMAAMKRGVRATIDSEYAANIAVAQKTLDERKKERDAEPSEKKEEAVAKAEKRLAKLQAAQTGAISEYSKLIDTNMNSPYAPLRRNGNHVVVMRSSAFSDAEDIAENPDNHTPAEVKAAKKFIKDNRSNADHYQVHFSENALEAERKAIELGKKGTVQQFKKNRLAEEVFGSTDMSGVIYRVRKQANDLDGVDTNVNKRALNNLLTQLHIQLLSEKSARHSELKRDNVAGSDDNMMRSFYDHGLASASFLSGLHKTKEITDALDSMQRESRDRNATNRSERTDAYNEIAARHQIGMESRETPLVDKTLKYTSAYMLLSKPLYYVQNAVQPWAVSLPVLMGKHGARAAGAMFTAYKQVSPLLATTRLTADTISKLPKDDQQMVQDLMTSGRLNFDLDQDMGDRLKGNNPVDGAIAKLQGVAERVETINRVTTAIAAYRLELKRGASHEAATNYAGKIVYDTHGDYSGFEAPRIMRSNVGRIATQFRKFQMIQISLLAKLTSQAFRKIEDGMSDAQKQEIRDERAAGQKALAYTLATTFTLGGTMALPGYTAIAWILGKAFGDDDEPDDPEAQEARMRKAIGDPFMADLLLKGAAKAVTGVDTSPIFGGWGNMLSILPYTKVEDMSRSTATNIVAGLAGPAVSQSMKIFEGMGKMAEGDMPGALQKVLPTGFANVVKAYELSENGVRRPNGAAILGPDEIGTLDVMAQALGLKSGTVGEKEFINRVTTTYEAYYRDEGQKVSAEYVKAYAKGDKATMEQARERWKELNDSRRENGFKVRPMSELFKAPQAARKNEQRVNRTLNSTGQRLTGYAQ